MAKDLECGFSHVGYNCSLVHEAGREHSVLSKSACQFTHVSGLWVTSTTKLPSARGKGRHTPMKLQCRLGEHPQVHRHQPHQGLWFFPSGRTPGSLETNKWRFGLIVAYFSVRENEWDSGYSISWRDLNVLPILLYLCWRLPISHKALYQLFPRWMRLSLCHLLYREHMQTARITPLSVGVLNLILLLSFNFSGRSVDKSCNSRAHLGHLYKCSNVINSECLNQADSPIRQDFRISQISNDFLSSYGIFCRVPDAWAQVKGWTYFFPFRDLYAERTDGECVQANTFITVFGNGKWIGERSALCGETGQRLEMERGWLFSGSHDALQTFFQRLYLGTSWTMSPRVSLHLHPGLWKVASNRDPWSLGSLQCLLVFPGSVPDTISPQVTAPMVT